MRTGSKEDVYASQASILLTTSVRNALQVNSMMFIKEYAESSAELTKSTTLTQGSATALKDSILFKVFALDVILEKYMMNTKENASSLSAKVSTNSTQLPPKLVCVFLNTSAFKEYVPTARLDTIMIATVTDVFVNLASSREEDSVILSAQATKHTSTENANAIMELL
jgi:hypothetical protein